MSNVIDAQLEAGPVDSAPPVPAASPPVARSTNNPLDMSPAEFRQALARRGENRRAFIEWIRQSLVDGVDYGAVPLRRGGFSKPSLRKPGAEKICGMLGVTATFPTLKEYERAALEGRTIQQIILRCHLVDAAGNILADGVGARDVEQDQGDLNKALKMAEKSAHIDATLRMAGLSEIFTQDLEDMPPERIGTADTDEPNPFPSQPQVVHQQAAQQQRSAQRQQARASTGRYSGASRVATDKQIKLLRYRLYEAALQEADLCEKFGVENISALPFDKVNDALAWIKERAA